MSTTVIVNLRRQLHQIAELSGNEHETSTTVKAFVDQYAPDEIVEHVGGTGLLVVYNGKEKGPTLAFRCELDALPIQEVNEDIVYRSKTAGISHKCGHDGHMAMVAALAEYCHNNRPKRGRVVLLFQPAEETGQGAQWMLEDKKWVNYAPDYIFALHNLPGYPAHQIVLREQVFAAASCGLIATLKGRTSHAAEPENGQSPALAMAQIITAWNDLSNSTFPLSDFGICTVVHARLGEKAFGTSPGSAQVMATFRAYHDADLNRLMQQAQQLAIEVAQQQTLQIQFEKQEAFASTKNDDEAINLVKNAALQLKLNMLQKDTPFRWSEDFGQFTQQYKGAMFGLGVGEHHPDLHNANYDFNDEVLPTGTAIFKTIINNILNH